MIQKKMPKEPSKNFFKIFLVLFVINIILSVFVYFVSPEQVPSKLTSQGFEGYRSKTSVLFPILFQLLLLPMALIFYKIMPAILKIYPKFLQNFYMKFSGLLLGINPEGLDIGVLISKYISVLILTMSVFLIPFNLVMLGFAFEIPNLNTYLMIFIVLFIIMIIPAFRIFSKKLQ